MKICFLIGDKVYGEGIVDNIKRRGPPEWEIKVFECIFDPSCLIEEPWRYLPVRVSCDLIISLGLHPDLVLELPSLAAENNVKAVIVPLDKSDWLPLGLQRELTMRFTEKKIQCSFPKPFCSLVKTGSKYIDEFAGFFGKPNIAFKVEKEVIKEAKVIRGAPCGSTWKIAEKITGVEAVKAGEKAGLIHHFYCRASTKIDRLMKDSVMHLAAYILKREIEKSLKTK